MDLKKIIKENSKRQVKDNSVDAYVHLIKKLNFNNEITSLDFLYNIKKILGIISHLAITTRKNYISAICITLTAVGGYEILYKKYKQILDELVGDFNDQLARNEKSDKQEKNWVSLQFLKDRVSAAREKWEREPNNMFLLQDYIIGMLYTEMPPARLDYSNMMITDYSIESEKQNFFIKSTNTFLLNEYKSSKKYGSVYLKIKSPELIATIKHWLKLNTSDYFLINKAGRPLSEHGLGQSIIRIFSTPEKHIYLNLIRSITVSESIDYQAIHNANELASGMLHSPSTQQSTYFKHSM